MFHTGIMSLRQSESLVKNAEQTSDVKQPQAIVTHEDDDVPNLKCFIMMLDVLLKQVHFLPCDAMRCTVFVIVILSVHLSVCHTRALCPHGLTYDHDFFTIW